MSDEAIRQLILAFENYLTQAGFGQDCVRTAQARGWLDQQGQATDEGKRLCLALASQVETRSAFRNVA